MALYQANNQTGGTPQSLGASSKTIVQITAQTTGLRRAFIFEWDVGADGLPNATDCAIVWDVSAQTSLGTGTTSVSSSLDQADAAATTVATSNMTAEPTTTANGSRWSMGMNQRASYRWQVNAGGPGEIVVPATNLAGYGIRAKSSTYASTTQAAFFYRE